MIKNISFKRLLAFIIALLNLLTVMPAMTAAASDGAPVAYDAYIKGNFVQGQELEAMWSYEGDYAQNDAETVVTWYAQNRFSSGSSNFKTLGTGKTYTVPENYTTTGNGFSVFFTVTPKDVNGTVGETTVSAIGYKIIAKGNTTATPTAIAQTIRPQNAAGTMGVGDTVVARYSYYEVNGFAENGTTFTWYTRDRLTSERTLVQEESYNDTYVIKAEDFGKWLEVDITPKTLDEEGTEVVGAVKVAKNHVSNVGFTDGVTVASSGFTRGTGKFNRAHMISDVNGPYSTSVNSVVGYFYIESAKSVSLIFDAGKIITFDGIYQSQFATSGKNWNNIVISYYDSMDETEEATDDSKWVSLDLELPDATYTGIREKEYILSEVKKSRYLKFTANGTGAGGIYDFFPYMTANAQSTLELKGQDKIYVLIDEPYVDPGYVALDATGDEISDEYITYDESRLDVTNLGEYPVTYTLEQPGMPAVTVTRTVVVGTGAQTLGDYAFNADVTSTNATGVNVEGVSHLTDGNYNTLWEGTAIPTEDAPVSAIIELSEETAISRFELDEEGDNIQAFNIYTSNDKEEWTKVYEGTTAGSEFSDEFELTKAKYVKLEITDALAAPQIKDMEIHVADADKPVVALEEAGEVLEELIEAQEHRDGYVYANLALPVRGTDIPSKFEGIEIEWDSLGSEAISNDGIVSLGEENVDVTLFATVVLKDSEENVISSAEDSFPITVSKKGTPKAINVHMSGNFVYGQDATIGFDYFDESGIPMNPDAIEYKWYRSNYWGDQGTGAIPGATSKTYTFTEGDFVRGDSRTYQIFASVTAANKAGDVGVASYSGFGPTPVAASTALAPTVKYGYIGSASENATMEVGDTLQAHYAYTEVGGTPEGDTTFIWKTRDKLDSSLTTTVQKAKTAAEGGDKYTLTESDYGKWIECVITPVSETGEKGVATTVKNHYGNAFLAEGLVSTGSSGYRSRGLAAGKVLAYEGGVYLYGTVNSSSDTEVIMGINTLEPKKFNGFFVESGCAFTNAKLSWSTDNVNFSEAILDKTTVTANSDFVVEIKQVKRPDGTIEEFSGLEEAQYFKFTGTKTGYQSLYTFYPYISADAHSRIILDSTEETVVKGQPVSVLDGMSAKDAYGNDVTGIVEINGSVDSNVLGEQKVIYTLEIEGFPTERVVKTFTVVTGVQAEGDVAFGAKASASVNANDAANLVDGNSYTSWTGTGTAADIVLDFGEDTGISTIALDEDGNVETVTVLVSDNGSDWKTVESNAVLDENGEVSFTPVETKYVKLSLTYTTAPTINDIEMSVSDVAKVTLAEENLDLDVDLDDVTEDIALPTVGDYGTTIAWACDPEGVITSEGVINRTKDDQTVTLTATISLKDENGDDIVTPVTKEFEVTVSAKEVKKESSGGGSSSYFKTPTLSQAATVTAPIESYETFVDVPDKHWAAPYINKLAELGVVSGRAANSYAPEAQITRAEYLKLLVTSLGLTAENAKANFADVSKDDWYYDCVAIASTLGIATGADGAFMPNAPILRRDMAVLAERALKVLEASLSVETDAVLADLDSVAEYAKPAVVMLAQAGIINGNENGEFMPDNLATRAQTAKIIYMLQESVKGAE